MTRTAPHKRGLTDLQADILWLLAQGNDFPTTAALAGVHRDTVTRRMGEVYARLGTRSLPHAVFISMVHGQIGAYRDCGTRKAYLRHLKEGLVSCARCREANRRYVVVQRSRPEPIRVTPTHIKIFQAFSKGAQTLAEVSTMTGIKHDRIGSHIAVVYRRLRIQDHPYADRRREAVEMLRSQGVIV